MKKIKHILHYTFSVFFFYDKVHTVHIPWLQIAALSPADINYEETLSTLRFGKKKSVV